MNIHLKYNLCLNDLTFDQRRVSPSDGPALLVVDLNELAEAAGIIIMGCFGVSKSLRRKNKSTLRNKNTTIAEKNT